MVAFARASDLLSRDVRYRDIRLGVAVDLLLDLDSRRVVGFDVVCGDHVRRFLPLAACDTEGDHLTVGSALVLMDDAFYRKRGRSLAELRGRPVRDGEKDIGVLEDLVVDRDGNTTALVVETRSGPVELALDDALVVGAEALRPAV